MSTDGSAETHLAGLDGIDSFNIEAGGGAPTVVWGGIGADTINVTATFGEYHDPIGIMVVNVGNLTAETFVDFDLSMVHFDSDFDWSQIDVVVLNPESADHLFIDGSEIRTHAGRIPVTYSDPYDGSAYQYGSVDYLATDDISDWYTAGQHHAASYRVDPSLLGGGVTSVFAPTAVAGFWDIRVYGNGIPGDSYINSEDFRLEDYEYELSQSPASFTSRNYGQNGTAITSYAWTNYNAFGVPFSDGWSENLPFAYGASTIAGIGPIYDINDIGPWFVVGGSFGAGGLVSNGAYTVTMPDPQGDTDAGSGATDLSSGGGSIRVTNFNVSSNAVVFNGGPINPNALDGQVTVTQNGSDTEIRDNGALLATLVGVSLASWQSAAVAQSLGSSSDDAIAGTSAANLIASGAGSDAITAGAGDDTILYTSGNDVIVGNGTRNTGFDTLDLSKYTSGQVSFTMTASHDVLITTPDGVIELDYQARYALGDANNNIEQILFSDTTLDEAAIRARALGDQSTTGNDNIQGSILGDLILDGVGNDTIMAGGGDDTFFFHSGNDVVDGHGTLNTGFDTLDLSKYTASEVTFDVSGYDVLISKRCSDPTFLLNP